MRHRKKCQWVAVCFVLLALVSLMIPRGGHAQVVNYTVTDLGTLGGAQSKAFGINSCGRVVGESAITGSTFIHAFTWNNGQIADITPSGSNVSALASSVNAASLAAGSAIIPGSSRRPYLLAEGSATEIGTLGGDSAIAHDINDNNQVVGESETAGPPGTVMQRGFIWDSVNGMVAIPTLTGDGSNGARGINNAGQIVGQSDTASGQTHAFLFSGGALTDLGTLGTGVRSFANKINDSGEVVGQSTITPGGATPPFHGFIWSATTGMLDMGTLPGDIRSIAYDINTAGQSVGYSEAATSIRRAFVYTRTGGMLDLNDFTPGSGWTLTEAHSINDRGQIVGFGINPSGQTHAFLLTPNNLGDPPPCSTPTPPPDQHRRRRHATPRRCRSYSLAPQVTQRARTWEWLPSPSRARGTPRARSPSI